MLGAIVLTGRGAEDPDADPAQEWWAGCRAVDWCVQSALKSEAKAVVTVGGQGYGFAFVADPQPDRPLAGVMAAIEVLKAAGCDSTVILSIEIPAALPSDLQPLLARRGGACFRDFNLPMLLAFNAIPEDLDPDWTFEQLIEAAGLTRVHVSPASRLRVKGGYTPEEKQTVIAGMPR